MTNFYGENVRISPSSLTGFSFISSGFQHIRKRSKLYKTIQCQGLQLDFSSFDFSAFNHVHDLDLHRLCCCVSHRRAGVRADVAALPPGQVEAPDELQVEGMAAVEHGEAHDVGLIVHHVVQPEQREVLETERGREREEEGKSYLLAVGCDVC